MDESVSQLSLIVSVKTPGPVRSIATYINRHLVSRDRKEPIDEHGLCFSASEHDCASL